MAPRRFRRTELLTDGVVHVLVARTFCARLLGLAFLSGMPSRCALLLPGCSCVHTFGMRFSLEIRFLDERSRVLRRETAVPPRRLLREPGAAAVLEWRSEDGGQAEPTSEERR